jgi:hypothetical protein
MKTVGLCTHFTDSDEWAFNYAFQLAQRRQLRLNICHWLASPYTIRRDMVYTDLFDRRETVPVTPEILTKLELQLREYYEPKLADFTDVAFKLCEGFYQVELIRCFRQHLLDLVVMGYPPAEAHVSSGEQSLIKFAQNLAYPLIIVGGDGPDSFLLNAKAYALLDQLELPAGNWQVLDDTHVSWQVLQSA